MASQPADLEDFNVHTYCPEVNRLYDENDEQASQEAAKTIALVRSLYAAGTPLYTKEAMRSIMRQLKDDTNDIFVRAIDGQLVTFLRETGEILETDERSEYDWLIGNAFIRFFSIQDLMEHGKQYPSPLSLCSIWIYHELVKKRRETGELCHSVPDQSKEEVEQFFKQNQVAWEATKECNQLRAILSDAIKPRITKIIAFACGGMAFSNRVPWATRCAYQHALILTIKDAVNAHQDQASHIKCYVQDPVYCDLDHELLGLDGITTLDSPEGFLEVDDFSIVLSFGPDIAVRQIVADIACPAMMIWDRDLSKTDEIDVFSSSTDPNSPRLTKMLSTLYTELEFPGDQDAFKYSAIFVRKDSHSQRDRSRRSEGYFELAD